jgi:hypothetical protein
MLLSYIGGGHIGVTTTNLVWRTKTAPTVSNNFQKWRLLWELYSGQTTSVIYRGKQSFFPFREAL